MYGQKYIIEIAHYRFGLVWRPMEGCEEVMMHLAMRECQDSLQRTRDDNSRCPPTEIDESEYRSWHVTRIETEKSLAVRDVKKFRVEIGKGSFDTVF
jgi:hypothetical protein